MVTRKSIGWPITLGVVMIVLLVLLTVGWIVVNLASFQITNRQSYVAVLAIGTIFLLLVLVGVILYLLLSIKAIRLNQRQSNFIDSVSHELKSPIASLKLYLQTLSRHKLNPQQQTEFHRFMLQDLQRLDHLIDHLLEVARLDEQPDESEAEDVELGPLLTRTASGVCQRHNRPESTISVHLQPMIVRGRPIDLEVIFRNLMDNAVKYSGEHPQVEVETAINFRGRVVTRIKDNGPGIPYKYRRKVFRRFYRMGSELERARTGTGLGLFIVRTLVKRQKGNVSIRSGSSHSGTVFEVELLGRRQEAVESTDSTLHAGAGEQPQIHADERG